MFTRESDVICCAHKKLSTYGMSTHENIQTVYVGINELIPATYNPRKHDKKAKEKLTESIARFGLIDPIIVNSAPERMNIVIGGHFRLLVAKELGFCDVPVVYVNIPDIDREKELNLRLNRNTGEFDYDLLKEFDMSLLLDVGFDDKDLSAVWADISGIDDESVPKEEISHEEPITKIGDMYQLGGHRLICGDSLDATVVQRLMGEDRADMVYCDPIYNISLDYCDGVSTNGKYQGDIDDSRSDEEYENFISTILANALSVANPDTHVFSYCDQRYIWLLQQLFTKHGVRNRRVCLWIKNNFNMTPQVAFNKAYEPCVYGTIGKPYLHEDVVNLHEIMNQNIDAGNRTHDDIFSIFDIWLAKRDAADEYEHPTQKPLSLHEKPLKRCTKPGDIVIDLFGGSGSTLLACEQMHRRARLCEINPAFCDVIIRRFEKMTGKVAQKLND